MVTAQVPDGEYLTDEQVLSMKCVAVRKQQLRNDRTKDLSWQFPSNSA
ncbi:MAG: hypothetical protein PUG43_01515 [Clostridiales bacterium]|nr:hypothetical protein [Clostridiales bacterium]